MANEVGENGENQDLWFHPHSIGSQQCSISSTGSTHFQNSGLVTIHRKRSNENNSVSYPLKSFLLLILHHKYKLLLGGLLTFHKYLLCLLIQVFSDHFIWGTKGKTLLVAKSKSFNVETCLFRLIIVHNIQLWTCLSFFSKNSWCA